jgi:hypothetical protein
MQMNHYHACKQEAKAFFHIYWICRVMEINLESLIFENKYLFCRSYIYKLLLAHEIC